MKSKLFLTVLLLAAITTIGISREKDIVPFSGGKTVAEVRTAELMRIYKLPIDAQSLVGVKGINVLVEELEEDAKSTGLTDEQLKTDVELKLRLAGIKVNSEDEMLASNDKAYIYVVIDTNSHNDSPNIVSEFSVKFNQSVTLVRNPYVRVRGITWSHSSLGMLPKSRFPEMARKAVKDYVDKFINDYLTANPKK